SPGFGSATGLTGSLSGVVPFSGGFVGLTGSLTGSLSGVGSFSGGLGGLTGSAAGSRTGSPLSAGRVRPASRRDSPGPGPDTACHRASASTPTSPAAASGTPQASQGARRRGRPSSGSSSPSVPTADATGWGGALRKGIASRPLTSPYMRSRAV